MTQRRKVPDTIDELCALMKHNVLYPSSELRQMFEEFYQCNVPGLSRLINSESKKKWPRIFKHKMGSKVYYTVSKDYDVEFVQKTIQQNTISEMALKLKSITTTEHRNEICQWIDQKFGGLLDECVKRHLKNEFKEHILPILISHIESTISEKDHMTEEKVQRILQRSIELIRQDLEEM